MCGFFHQYVIKMLAASRWSLTWRGKADSVSVLPWQMALMNLMSSLSRFIKTPLSNGFWRKLIDCMLLRDSGWCRRERWFMCPSNSKPIWLFVGVFVISHICPIYKIVSPGSALKHLSYKYLFETWKFRSGLDLSTSESVIVRFMVLCWTAQVYKQQRWKFPNVILYVNSYTCI